MSLLKFGDAKVPILEDVAPTQNIIQNNLNAILFKISAILEQPARNKYTKVSSFALLQ